MLGLQHGIHSLMSMQFQLRQLITPDFLRELHHFLWTEPRLIGNCVDAGWNCRDHVLVLSFLLQDFGIESAAAHGEAFFGKGPTASTTSQGYSQNPHSWIVVKDLGAIDLSIKPELASAGERYEVPLSAVFLNRGYGKKKSAVRFFSDSNSYQKCINELSTQRNAAGAVYLQHEMELLDPSLRLAGAGWARSALAVDLNEIYGNPSPLYAELITHLSALLRKQTASLSKVTSKEAWAIIASRAQKVIHQENFTGSDLRSAA